jgi:glycosyltransferase involved in cell wall biosynthesis
MNETKGEHKRVAFLLADLEFGGVERFALNLASGLAQRGVEVDMVLVKATGQYMSEVPSGVNVVDLCSPRAISCLPRLFSYLRNKRPHAMITGQDHISVVGLLGKLLARGKTRMMVTHHTMSLLESASGGNRRKTVVPRIMRMLYPFADELVAVSEDTREDLIRTVGKAAVKTRVIYNGVVTPEFVKTVKEHAEHPWFAEGQPPVVMAAGRLSAASGGHKDYPTVVRAFAILRKSVNARLMILGDGEERENLIALAHELGIDEYVYIPGFVPNPGAYMTKADVFVLSSFWECLPTVAIESLAAGTPVVATDGAGGTREVVRDEQCGVMVPVGDPEAMANAIKDILTGSGARTPEETWSRFTLSAMVDNYMDALHLETP